MNPFHYGSPVEGAQFAGRAREVEAITSRIRNHISVVLLSPRRYGKTSVLLRVEKRLGPDDPAIVHVNVLRCRDLGALASALVVGAYRIPGGRWHRARQAVPEFLKRIRMNPNVSFEEGGKPSFSFGPKLAQPDADKLIADVYAILSEAAQRHPAALVLDEFQAITDLGGHLPDLLKGLADKHPKVSLVLAGSKQHLMERLVIAETAPLYGMAQKISLGPLDEDEMISYLLTRSTTGGKQMSREVARLVLELAGPVPNDIQHLAYEAFEVAGESLDAASVGAGLAQAVAHEAATYSDEYSRRPTGQRSVLTVIAIAHRVDEPASAAFVESVALANASSVRKAIIALREDELLVERSGAWMVADPFFAEWLRNPGVD